MPTVRNDFTYALGIALLLQAVASLIGGMLFNSLVKKSSPAETLLNLAQHQSRAQMSVFIEIITALGIIWLGVMLFRLLQNVNQTMATIAFVFYVLEASLLLMSRFCGYAAINVGSMYSANGDTTLKVLGEILLNTKEYIGNATLIPFGIGAIIFYYLLFISKAIPSWIALWGLVTVVPIAAVSILYICGVKETLAFEIIMIPYVPFEFFTGLYVLTKGLSNESLNPITDETNFYVLCRY
jgi:hypothetical protein